MLHSPAQSLQSTLQHSVSECKKQWEARAQAKMSGTCQAACNLRPCTPLQRPAEIYCSQQLSSTAVAAAASVRPPGGPEATAKHPSSQSLIGPLSLTWE